MAWRIKAENPLYEGRTFDVRFENGQAIVHDEEIAMEFKHYLKGAYTVEEIDAAHAKVAGSMTPRSIPAPRELRGAGTPRDGGARGAEMAQTKATVKPRRNNPADPAGRRGKGRVRPRAPSSGGI